MRDHPEAIAGIGHVEPVPQRVRAVASAETRSSSNCSTRRHGQDRGRFACCI
ncbi:hypothetical protein ACFQ0B_54965 [Nonomuraea thailandensis]